MAEQWSASEQSRREAVLAGKSVLANLKNDRQLIAWAKENGLYVFIGRPSNWRNPYVLGEDGDRPTVINSFRAYFAKKLGLQKRVPELKGKVLGCYCYPEPCHGEVLLQQIQQSLKDVA